MDFLKGKTIYLMRHGQTEYNLAGICQGRVDSPLTALGRQQVEISGGKLKNELCSFTDEKIAFYVSPLGRTQASARIVQKALNRSALTPIITPHLVEVDFGLWEGKDLSHASREAKEKHGDRWHFMAPGGESYEKVLKRVEKWLLEIEKIPQQHIVAMCHGMVGRVLRGYLGGIDDDIIMANLPIPQDSFFILKGREEREV